MGIEIRCRYCNRIIEKPFLNLGMQPLSNDYLTIERIPMGQHYLPLRVCVCSECRLVQIADSEMPDVIFNEEYKYFSSFSTSWLEHCKLYVDMIYKRLSLNEKSEVFEIASNDGYLLQYFSQYDISPIGIEPSVLTAKSAMEKGIHTITEFFGVDLATRLVDEGHKADLIIANNVMAHVPDIKDFVKGFEILLKETGTVTVENPHFLNVLRLNQFDTIYHEHFSYVTLGAVSKIFEDCGLKIYDVEELKTHGGSLRLYATHKNNELIDVAESVERLLEKERKFGLQDLSVFDEFSEKVKRLKNSVLSILISIKREGKSIAGYGAAAKGNTLFNYCGIGTEYIDYVVDVNPNKQGLFLPGSMIPIYEPERIKKTKPDYVLIIPWNIKEEIMDQMSFIREWGGRFIVFIPEVEVL